MTYKSLFIEYIAAFGQYQEALENGDEENVEGAWKRMEEIDKQLADEYMTRLDEELMRGRANRG